MKNLFGIMQGRLLPKYLGRYQAHPVNYWQDEFSIASNFGFDCIEFIFDYNEADKNPLMSKSGLEKIMSVSRESNILIKSVCADYFMLSPIYVKEKSTKTHNLNILEKLVHNSYSLGVKDIIIPLVDSSSILNNKSKKYEAKTFLQDIIEKIKNMKINLCLETDLPPTQFYDFVKSINRPQIKINYDTGNSASLGYNFKEEFEIFGNLVTNIHIKDRKFNDGPVELGKGDFNFKSFFNYLSNKKFNGIFIMQAFRGEDGPSSLKLQLEYIKNCIKNNYIKDR